MLPVPTARLYQRLFWRQNWNLFRMAWILHLHVDHSFNRWRHQLHLLIEMDEKQPHQ